MSKGQENILCTYFELRVSPGIARFFTRQPLRSRTDIYRFCCKNNIPVKDVNAIAVHAMLEYDEINKREVLELE